MPSLIRHQLSDRLRAFEQLTAVRLLRLQPAAGGIIALLPANRPMPQITPGAPSAEGAVQCDSLRARNASRRRPGRLTNASRTSASSRSLPAAEHLWEAKSSAVEMTSGRLRNLGDPAEFRHGSVVAGAALVLILTEQLLARGTTAGPLTDDKEGKAR